MITPSGPSPLRIAAVASPLLAVIALAGCASPGAPSAASPVDESGSREVELGAPRIVIAHDGGLTVLEGDTLEPVADLPLDGFLRVNAAGDGRHVIVSTDDGFRVVDTGVATEEHGDHAHYYAEEPRLTELAFPAEHPGHVTTHHGITALFADGTGEVQLFDADALAEGEPEVRIHHSEEAHHGVAVALDEGALLTTLGDDERRTGAIVLDDSGNELTRSEDCPGVHGETVSAGDVVVLGCEDGALVFDGAFTKIAAPDAYGRIGNQAGSPESPIVLGDYKVDADADLERPTRVSLIDTEQASMRLVELGTSYTFRSLARGPHGEALVLGTDGAIHVIDPVSGTVSKRISVIDEWSEPVDWQQPRPALEVRGHVAYVTDPSDSSVHAVELESGEVTASAVLDHVPNELATVGE
ncbi:zinc metallochaperone AztD [Agromyces lapidis]|uniref:Zinc metallochaperone AztD n=1 Tax=Agromyces lapidis TaxID=279574 RepID=A0ABV5SNK1_9MICO|nr:zinc metallochaperone AztD [Agromyces lapidis]